jgi:hypothetical protein
MYITCGFQTAVTWLTGGGAAGASFLQQVVTPFKV